MSNVAGPLCGNFLFIFSLGLLLRFNASLFLHFLLFVLGYTHVGEKLKRSKFFFSFRFLVVIIFFLIFLSQSFLSSALTFSFYM